MKLCLIVLIVVLTQCGFADNYGQPTNSPVHNEVIEATKLIEACPAWTQIESGDIKKTHSILEILGKLSQYQTSTLRRAIKQFIDTRTLWEFNDFAKIFMINRYIFNVPQWVNSEDNIQFGGWIGIGEKNGKIDMLFPFERKPSGKLELVGRHIGYNGPPSRRWTNLIIC
jgi:hypothetical protein